jgi:hypothetical protein
MIEKLQPVRDSASPTLYIVRWLLVGSVKAHLMAGSVLAFYLGVNHNIHDVADESVDGFHQLMIQDSNGLCA